MAISIFGYKLNLEVLILIGVVYLILVGHTFCGCCNFGMMTEGMETTTKDIALPTQIPAGGPIASKVTEDVSTKVASTTGKKGGSVAGSVTTGGQEGFVGANTNYGESSQFDLSSDMPINTSSWNAQNMTVVPGQPLSEGVKKFLAREPQEIPLPEGQLDMFANTPFKPECCPNTYSNSTGCACMTGPQYNYLITRGGNNVPYSEY
uniref:Uncharacterized protein n=1 Tax=viral metagenome TaxID=1070528 RepID=A0A6C0AS67_9ZZZZ